MENEILTNMIVSRLNDPRNWLKFIETMLQTMDACDRFKVQMAIFLQMAKIHGN